MGKLLDCSPKQFRMIYLGYDRPREHQLPELTIFPSQSEQYLGKLSFIHELYSGFFNMFLGNNDLPYLLDACKKCNIDCNALLVATSALICISHLTHHRWFDETPINLLPGVEVTVLLLLCKDAAASNKVLVHNVRRE